MSNHLPELTVILPADPQAITRDIAEEAGIEDLASSDPAYRIAQSVALRESLVRHEANEQAKGVMLQYARGPELDHLGDTYYRDALGTPVLRLEGEDDEAYRLRLQQSPEGLSVAGPESGYAFFVRSFSADIKAVDVASPAPTTIVLTILQHTGTGAVDASTIKAIEDYIWPRRPLTDFVSAQSAQIIPYRVVATLTIEPGTDNALIVAASEAAGAQYVARQHRLGGKVTLSGIHAALTVPGVEKVDLDQWDDVICTSQQAPYCESLTVTEVTS